MQLNGTFFLRDDKINFLFFMEEFGEKSIFVEYGAKILDLRYFINTFKTGEIFSLIKDYYNSGIFLNHVKKVLDGNEIKKYIFKFLELIIEIELPNNVEHNSIISKITELNIEFDEEVDKFKILAFIGNKIIHKKESKKIALYQKSQIELGYYNSKNFNKILDLVGTYIDLNKGYRIISTITETNSMSFVEKREQTIKNFLETGLFSFNNGKMVENNFKEKLYRDSKMALAGVMREEMIQVLIE